MQVGIITSFLRRSPFLWMDPDDHSKYKGLPILCHNSRAKIRLSLFRLSATLHNDNNTSFNWSSHNARQHRLSLRLSRTTAVHELCLGCHAGQPMVLDQRWEAADSGPGQSTLTLSPPEIAAEVYAPISWRYQLTTHLSTPKGWKAELTELVDLLRTAYPREWSPISCRSGAGQGKYVGQRPTFYHWANRVKGFGVDPRNFAIFIGLAGR